MKSALKVKRVAIAGEEFELRELSAAGQIKLIELGAQSPHLAAMVCKLCVVGFESSSPEEIEDAYPMTTLIEIATAVQELSLPLDSGTPRLVASSTASH